MTTPNTPNTPTISNLKDWRKLRTKEANLSNGLTVRLRTVSLVDMAAQGTIPPTLLGKIEKLQATAGGQAAFKFEDLPEFAEAINAVVIGAVASPRVLGPKDVDRLVEELGATFAPTPQRHVLMDYLERWAAGERVPELDHPGRVDLADGFAASLQIHEIPLNDRMKIFEQANGEALALAPFPGA